MEEYGLDELAASAEAVLAGLGPLAVQLAGLAVQAGRAVTLDAMEVLVTQGKMQEMLLEIESTQLVGHAVEITGRTEPGAALIINAQPVPNIAKDGTFRHFTEPLLPGEHTIVVIGQNRRGGTNTKRVSVVVPK